jgi:hypothetical protein
MTLLARRGAIAAEVVRPGPSVPTSFTFTVNGSNVILTWVNAPGSTGLTHIYKDGSPLATVASGVTTYTATGISGTHTFGVANSSGAGLGVETTPISVTVTAIALAAIGNQTATVGVAYLQPLTGGSGGTGNLTYSVTTTLPKGLSLVTSAGKNGVQYSIAGTPSGSPGTTSVTVEVTDQTTPTAQTATRTFNIVVSALSLSNIGNPTGFPFAANDDVINFWTASGTAFMPSSYETIGDLALLKCQVGLDTSQTLISTISSNNGMSSGWFLVERNIDPSTGIVADYWAGNVIGTTLTDSLLITFTDNFNQTFVDLWADSKTGLGPGTIWTVVKAGQTTSQGVQGTTIVYPSLQAAVTTNPQCYDAFAVSGATATGSPTAGCTAVDSGSNSGNEMIYKNVVASGATTSPTSSQTTAAYVTVGVVWEASLTAGNPGVLSLANPGTLTPTVGTLFTKSLVASGGSGSYSSYVVTAGQLPTGLKLSGSTITGTPTAVQSQTVTITVTDSSSATASVQFQINTSNPVAAGNMPSQLVGLFDINGSQDPGTCKSQASQMGVTLGAFTGYTNNITNNWSDLTTGGYSGNANVSPPYRLLLGVSMCPQNVNPSAVTSNLGIFTTLAQNLIDAGYGNAILRIGWECNNAGQGGYSWGGANGVSGVTGAKYQTAFQAIATTMKAVSGNEFLTDFNVIGPTGGGDLCQFNPFVDGGGYFTWYPGDSYVDIVSQDFYDYLPNNGAAWYQTQMSKLVTEVAIPHGKGWACPEWGLPYNAPNQNGPIDDTGYMQGMIAIMKGQVSGIPACAYQSYFMDGEENLLSGSVPNSLALFSAAF